VVPKRSAPAEEPGVIAAATLREAIERVMESNGA
jgi:hypothetical protein